MLPAFPEAKTLLADKGYDADWLRDALVAHSIRTCITSRANQNAGITDDIVLIETPQNRKHAWPAQGLAQDPYKIQPMRAYLLLKHLHRCCRHLSALI
jgi:transposase